MHFKIINHARKVHISGITCEISRNLFILEKIIVYLCKKNHLFKKYQQW